MYATPALFLYLVSCLVVIEKSIAHGDFYEGCVREVNHARHFKISPGIYNPRFLTADVCMQACAQSQKRYAALSEGKYCTCADTVDISETDNDTLALCNAPCPGDGNITCGGRQAASVYTTDHVLSGLPVVTINNENKTFVEMYKPVSVLVQTETAHLNIDIVSAGKHDTWPTASYYLGTNTAVVNHTFAVFTPGKFSVSVKATDTYGNSARSTVVRSADADIQFQFDCPLYVAVDEEAVCKIKVLQGTNMTASVTFGNGKQTEFNPPDAAWYKAGDANPGDLYTESAPDGNYMLVNHGFHSNGSLVGLKVNVKEVGPVIFQVFRPVCDDPDQTFCYRSHSCINSTDSCRKQGAVMRTYRCVGSLKYSFSDRSCSGFSSSSGSVNGSRFYELPVTYQAVYNQTVNLTENQTVYMFPSDSRFQVIQGDVLSVYQMANEGKIGTIPTADIPVFKQSAPENEVVAATDVTSSRTHFLVEALVIRPVTIRAPTVYDTPDGYNVTATVSSEVTGTVSMSSIIHVQYRVANVTWIISDYGEANRAFDVIVPEHPGTNSTYVIDWGDGYFDITQERNITHVYRETGELIVVLSAYNRLNSVTINKTVNIIDRIESAHISMTYPPASILGDVTSFDITLAQGSQVNCIIDIGNGTTISVDNVGRRYRRIENRQCAGQILKNITGNITAEECMDVCDETPYCITLEHSHDNSLCRLFLERCNPSTQSLTESSYDATIEPSWFFHAVPGTTLVATNKTEWTDGDGETTMDDCARQCLLQNCSSIEWTSSSDSCLMNSLNLYDEPSAMRQDPNVVLLNLNKDYCVDDMMLTVEKEQIDGLNTSGGVTMGLLDTDHAFLLAMTSVPEMQINLRARSAIRALVTQGERGTTNWLTSYTLEHSEDGIVWEKVTDNNGTEIEFEGNTDAETKVINRLPTIVLTRHLRIIAVNWTGAPAFRLGIQSCEAITMRYQLNYTFPALGVYNVQMNCSNVLTENQSVSADVFVPVESKITSFEWLEVGPVTFGENATIRVRADSGNNVVIKGTLNETVLTAGFYNDTSQEGTLLLKADDYKTIGHYQLLVVMDNFVSDPVENLTELWVDYRIENLTVQTTEYSVATGSEVNVTVSVGQGSRLQIQTGVALQSYMEYFEMLTANDTITYIFNLSDVGIITIPVHVSNPVSEALRNVSFKVQRPVSNMEFSALQNIHPIYPNADATITFSVACNVDDVLLPTNASAEFDFGDNKTATETLTSFVDNTFLVSVMNSTNAWLYSHNYSTKGTYITTLNVSNDINNMFLLTEVVIEEYIIGLSIGVNSRHARVNELVSLNGTIDWGSDHVYNWNLENGIPEGMYTTNSTASSSIFHRFRMPGVYNISLTASNQVNQMTVFDSIIVQHPIQNLSISGRKFSLRPIPEGKVNATFALQVEAPLPTDAIFEVEFGDDTPRKPATELLCTFSSADKCLEVSHIFTQPGDFTVTVFAWNLVSNVTAHFNHSVFDKISGLHKVLFYGNDSSGGHGDSHIYFPSHEPITFVSNQTSGTDLTYFWDFDDGSVHSTTVNEVIHVYSEPKEYAVTLNASNPMDSEVITKHIVIQRAVNMVELNETGPHATNESYKFFIWTDTMPTNASYCVFFDVPRLQWQKRCFGNVDHCSRACGDYPYSGDVSNGFTNSFRSVGKFTVNATVSNMVSTKSTSTMFIVTKGPCAIPKVDIKEPNQCLDLCDGQKRKVFYRSNPVIISSSVRLNCTSSPTANYIWGVNWYNTSIEQWQDMSRLFSNLSIAFNSTYLNRLEIPKNVLLYGIYNFTLNVSMVNEINLWQMDSVLVALNATPMSVIGGGSYTRLEYGANYTMNPLQYLRDPDNPISAEDNSLVSIDWFCEVPCRDSPGKCGCFQEGKQGDNPGKLPTPWVPKEGRDGDVINYNVVNFTMTIVSVLLYQENGTHSFWAVVKKVDPLTGFTRNSPNITMDVFLTQGDPPETTIECATNCMEKVNPFSKFSLRSVIAGFVKGVLYNYEWNMHDKLSNQSLVENLHNSWDRGEWRSKTATGLDSANLAINKDTFEGRYQEYFIISLKAYRRSSGPANFGMATYVILINEPPVAGNCTVSPNNGTSLQTKFSIKCQGFSDKDAPLSYEFGQRLSSGVVWFDQNVLPSTNKGVWLSPGRQEDDFKTSIVVRVKDHIQTHIDVDFQVKVELPDMEPTEFDNFLSGEEGIIAQSKKAKDIQAMIQISFAATSILDKNEDESGGGDSSGDPSQSRKLKEDIIEGLTSIDPAPNVQSARQFSQALGKVTNKREDCSDKIQEDSNQALSKVVDIVSDQAGDKDVDGDSLDLCAYEMFSTIGNLFDATSSIEGTNEYTTTPANSGQSDDSSSNNRAKHFSEQLEQNLDKLSDAILKKKVSGETASNFTTPKLSVTLYKSFTTGLDNATFRTGGCGSFKIGSMEGIFKNGNSTPYFVQGKALFQENNTRNWAEGSDGIKSNVLALDFKDEDGRRVVVSDRPEEIEVWIKQKGDNASVNEVHGITSRLDDPMGVHIIPIPQYAAVFLKIRRAENGNISGNSTNATSEDPMEPLKFILYVKKGSKPTEESHDWNCTVVTSLMLDDITDECGQKDKLSLDTCFFDHHTLNISSTESLYVSLRSYGSNETGNGTSADIASEEVLDLLNSNDLFNTSVSAHYTMEVFTTTCVYFDPEADKWSASGCRVGQLSSIQATQCFCNHLTSFAATFYVPMNTFDPAKSVFSNINYLNDNPLVFTFCISAVAVYIVLVIWARKADKMDVLKTGVLPLPDNEPHHTYGYEVTVWTGHRRGAGTTAHVSFILTGDQDETDPRTFHCVHRKILKRESIDSFLMTTSKPLGKLSHLRIWHDNHGNSPSWYFSRMLVEDLQSNEKYYFICNRWLAVEEDDGMVDRIIPVAGRVELVSFDHLFWTKTRRNLYDGHIWISVVNRPPRSRFTRVQRLTCCVSLLFCTMATNIMFYGQEDKVEKPEVIRLGPVTVTLQSIYIGVVSSLIVFPINLIIVSFFRYSGPRTPKKRPSVSESNLDLQENQHDIQDAENIQELQQQANYLGNDDGEKGERPLTTTPVGSSQINFVAPLSPKYPPRSPLVQGREKKEKKKFQFPWWVIFIAYGLSFASVGGSLYYCTEIAFTFGPEKSKDWLVSLIVGLVESVLMLQPVKVIILAMVYAIIIKKPDKDEDEDNPELKDDEEYIKVPPLSTDTTSKRRAPLPPDEGALLEARLLRFKEMKMHAVIREIVLYMVYLFLLMMCAYGNQDPVYYHLKNSCENTFVRSNYPEDLKFSMEKVVDRKSFWVWTDKILLPALYERQWYNGQIDPGKFVADRQNFLVGTARLRQVRIKPVSCKPPKAMAPYVTACRAPYNYLDEDQAAYGGGWRALNNSADSNSPNAWGFQSAIDLASYPFMGDKTWYGGGGYVADLGSSEATARTTIERLFQERWVDLFTRAVFVEFVLYNANKNVFIVSQIVIEFLETGGAFPNPRFHVFRLDRYVGPFMYVIMAAEILTACFTLYFLVLEFKKLRNERCQYFTGFWNVVEAILVSLILVTVVIFVYKLVSATLLMDEIRENPDTFHNMQYAVLWDELYSFLLGFIVFLANLKFLKLLRFNKRTSMLADVLRETAKPLAYFMAMFCIVFMGFVSCAYLLFSSKLLNYMNVVSVAETLLVMVLNKFDYSAVAEADGTLGPIFFLCYVVMVSFILINMFLSIIMEAFTMVRQDLDRQSNDYEIVQFMVQRLKAFIGVGGERANQNTVNSVYYEEVAGSGYRSENAEELNQKLESLLGHLTGIFYTDTQSKEVLKTGPEKKKKKQLFSSD